jgi:hypothetical protein
MAAGIAQFVTESTSFVKRLCQIVRETSPDVCSDDSLQVIQVVSFSRIIQ